MCVLGTNFSIQMDEDVSRDDVPENFQSSMKNLLMKKKELELEIQKRATADLERRSRELNIFIFSDTIGIYMCTRVYTHSSLNIIL